MSDRINVRDAHFTDAAAIGRVHIDCWRSTYAGLLSEKMLVNLSHANYQNQWQRHLLGRSGRKHYIYVAEHETMGVVGFVSGGNVRNSVLDHKSEIYALYLLDEFRGFGCGRILFRCLAKRLYRKCGSRLMVWVLSANPSRYFYEAMGGQIIATRYEAMGGSEFQMTAYGWTDVDELVSAYPPQNL